MERKEEKEFQRASETDEVQVNLAKNEDEDSGSDDDNAFFMFRSAQEVGSQFARILPSEEEIVFRYTRQKKSMKSRIYIENVTHKAYLAFYVWTSSPLFKIEP